MNHEISKAERIAIRITAALTAVASVVFAALLLS